MLLLLCDSFEFVYEEEDEYVAIGGDDVVEVEVAPRLLLFIISIVVVVVYVIIYI